MTVRSIIADVFAETGISPRDITGTGRFRHIVQARDKVCLRAREAGYSYPQIARVLNRDHSTIISAARREAARQQTVGE